MNGCSAAIIAMHFMVYGLGLSSSPLPDVKPKKADVKPPVTKDAPKAPQATGEKTLVTLQAVKADMPAMLRTLSDQSRIGLVLLSPAETRLTTNLVNIPFIDALRHVCALSNLTFLKVRSTYVVAAKEKLIEAYPDEYYALHPDEKPLPVKAVPPPEETVTQVFYSNYLGSGALADALGTVFPKEQLKLLAGPVQANPSVSEQETSTATGVQSSILKNDSELGTPSKILILSGPKSMVEQALSLAKQLDVERAQVSIEVTIYDISDTALKDLGISWTFGDTQIQERDNSGVNVGSFVRSPMSFDGVIKALEQNDKAKLLASPNVSVLDGERAFILIGDRINYPVLVGYSQTNAPIFSKEEERVGIYMQVAASVSNDDNVTLSLYPQVSSVTGFLNVNGASYPQISTREAQTTLRVRSGDTIVMGGLLKTSETASYDRVPFLSQLPFIGELFRHRRTRKESSQVIISIKPKVIRSHESR
jgi:type II secretory pathway component GspD/PulD (secretin)